MAFCSSCGTKAEEGARFCSSCGAALGPVPSSPPQAPSAQTPVKAGGLRKCPSCGAAVESFRTRCGSCGHELNSAEVAGSVQEFFRQIQEFESNVHARNLQKEDTGEQDRHKDISAGTVIKWLFLWPYLGIAMLFKKAKGTAAIGIIVLSIFAVYAFLGALLTAMGSMGSAELAGGGMAGSLLIAVLCIGGIVFLMIIQRPRWTADDKRLQSMIELFPVPNLNNDLMEFLILALSEIKPVDSTMARLFSLRAKHQLEWNRIWSAKCRQVYTKARISMKDDPAALTQIRGILAEAGLKL